MTKYFFCSSALVLLALVFFRCAGQAPPSGGAPDTVPPEIVESVPPANTLHFNDRKIALHFSEYVDRSSVEQSIFFSPPVGALSFDWSGTDVEISFSDSLRGNTTYIMTVGTDVIDRRNRNRMASAFALPFSTGDHIDSAAITGRVFGTPSDGIMIFAYKLDGIAPDTLNPMHTKPDYLTQTGKDGTFKLSNIATGSYRLIAVRDQYKNLVYDPQTDEYGIAYKTTILGRDSTHVSDVYFRMTKEDTTPPFVSSARATDQSHVVLRFSEPVDTSSVKMENFSIADTLKGAALNLLDVSPGEGTTADLVLTTSLQDSALTYRVVTSGLRDLHGNGLRFGADTAVFVASALPDTTRPAMDLAGIQDSARNIQADDTLRLSFSEPVQRSRLENGCHLRDSRALEIPSTFVWRGSTSVAIMPSSPLEFGTWYALSVVLDSLKDISGNGYRDSLWIRRFQTVEEKTLGSIAGVVREEVQTRGRLFVTTSEISSKTITPRQTVADSSGAFRFEHLPEGRYTLFAFRDADSNGVYTFGNPFPYRLAEKCSASSDTLKVRARWPLEGVVVRIQ